MMHIVTLGAFNARLLVRVLGAAVPERLDVHATKTRFAAVSLSGAILADRAEPVALVLDADTLEAGSLDEERTTLDFLVRYGAAGTPYRIVLAIPQLAGALFLDRKELEQALGREMLDADFFEARFRPRAVLERLLGDLDGAEGVAAVDALPDSSLRRIARHDAMQEIVAFLDRISSRPVASDCRRRAG